MGEESTDQEQVLNVHVHKKESKKEPEPTEIPKTFEPQPIGPEFKPKPTKKKKTKKWMIIILVSLVLIVGAGVGAYFYFNNQTTQNPKVVVKKSKTSTKTPVSALEPATVVTAVQEYVKTKYPQVMPEGTKLTGEQIYFKTSDAAPYWKISGEKFYINYSGDDASSVSTYYNDQTGGNDVVSARYVAVSNAMIKSLTDQGFVKNTDSVYGKDQYGNLAYTKDDVVCIASNPDNGSITPPASVACGKISKYTKNLDSYKEIEPYALAYKKAGDMQAGSVFSFSALKVGMSGYKNANVGLSNAGAMVGGAMGLFYKTPTGEWQFFKGTQQIIECSAYSTKDLQYAFAYENCYDSSKTGDAANVNVASFYTLQP